ncbi:MAG: HDOD domain-containing protein [Sedimenticola sp.]
MLKFMDKIRRHSAVAGGNFERIFEGADIPPLPAAISRLITEVSSDDPDLPKLSNMITAVPEVAHKVLSTVNSAYFSLPHKVSSIKHGVTILGLKNIKPLVLSFAMKESLPQPPGSLFQVKDFWSDSLLKALFARALADLHCKPDREEAFTAMLLADIALPVLLSSWGEYYEPLVEQWQSSPGRLSDSERQSFKWDHAQAGAWILQNWDFPAELVCFVGLHNADREQLRELELEDTVALPVTTAALLPSCRRPDPVRTGQVVDNALETFDLSPAGLSELLDGVNRDFSEICNLFDLAPAHGQEVLGHLQENLSQRLETEDDG